MCPGFDRSALTAVKPNACRESHPCGTGQSRSHVRTRNTDTCVVAGTPDRAPVVGNIDAGGTVETNCPYNMVEELDRT